MAHNICSVDGCESHIHGQGLCRKHYDRWRHHGSTEALVVRHKGTPEERFWAKVKKTESCWNWTGRGPAGYGYLSVNQKHVLAHRFAYELLVEKIPDGMQVDHRCHNRACVNPEHLRLATHKQNVENHQGPRSDNKSGVRGVHWFEPAQLWRAEIHHDGKCAYLAYFKSLKEAEAAVLVKRNELHSFNDRDRSTA